MAGSYVVEENNDRIKCSLLMRSGLKTAYIITTTEKTKNLN